MLILNSTLVIACLLDRRQVKKGLHKRIDYKSDDRYGQEEEYEDEVSKPAGGAAARGAAAGGAAVGGAAAGVTAEEKALVLKGVGKLEPGADEVEHREGQIVVVDATKSEDSGNGLAPKELLLLAEMDDPNVTELKLGHQDHFGNGGAKHVASVLTDNKHVTLLWLNDDQIKDTGVKALAKMIHNNTSLIELDLSSNMIEDLGAEALAKALAYNWRVKKCNITGNKISVDHVEKINKMLLSPIILRQALPRLHENDPTLSCLEMPRSLLQDSDVEGLMDAMNASTHVTRLLLPRNHIGPSGTHAISKALQTKEEVSVNGVKKIHCAVHTLDLNENKAGVRGAKEMAAVLTNNITLHTLYLADNAIGHDGATALASALLENSTLKRLFLDRNEIGDKGAIALGNAFDTENNSVVNTTLDTLWLTDNGIGRDGANKLRWALRIFDGPVSTLLLDGNEGVIKM